MQTILTFTNRWIGTAIPKLFLLFLGILLCILVVAALWDRRIKTMGAALLATAGVLLAAISLEEGIARLVGGWDMALRIRLLAGGISGAFFGLSLAAWKRNNLDIRYSLMWMAISLIGVLTSLAPGLLKTFPSMIGVGYGAAVSVLFILFLLLLTFHFSLAVSEMKKRQLELLQRIEKLEGGQETSMGDMEPVDPVRKGWTRLTDWLRRGVLWEQEVLPPGRKIRGTRIGAPLIIFLAAAAVLTTGLCAPQVMIGDEVTHYYMLITQVREFPVPNFLSEIPMEWGGFETRRYPHSFLWHYIGAVFFRVFGGSFAAVQVYHTLFLVQLLTAAYLLARTRRGVETRSAMVYLLLLASLPMTLIFSVAFYQDVPVAAQVLTAFYLLRRRRWLLASVFMILALWMKETALLFYPAFVTCLFFWTIRRESWKKTGLVLFLSLVLLVSSLFVLGKTIKVYAERDFYPVIQLEEIAKKAKQVFTPAPQRKQIKQQKIKKRAKVTSSPTPVHPVPSEIRKRASRKTKKAVVSEQEAMIIANHPGNLRLKENYFIYGGLLLWLLLCTGGVVAIGQRFHLFPRYPDSQSSFWLWGTGLVYIVLVALMLGKSQDARFYLPGVAFLLLPVAEKIVCLPKPKWIIIIIASLALMQTGYVMSKTYGLRQVSQGLREAIEYMEVHPPIPSKVFMYPEGNYRLFSVSHEWYLGYHLRDFWRGDDETRLAILQKYGIGAIVVKKHLVSQVDDDITNLGVYPDYFVRQLENGSVFRKVLDNEATAIYLVPEPKNE